MRKKTPYKERGEKKWDRVNKTDYKYWHCIYNVKDQNWFISKKPEERPSSAKGYRRDAASIVFTVTSAHFILKMIRIPAKL